MANRKMLPREIKVKQELETLQTNYNNLLKENKELRLSIDKQSDEIKSLNEVIEDLDSALDNWENTANRNQKLINLLVDIKL